MLSLSTLGAKWFWIISVSECFEDNRSKYRPRLIYTSVVITEYNWLELGIHNFLHFSNVMACSECWPNSMSKNGSQVRYWGMHRPTRQPTTLSLLRWIFIASNFYIGKWVRENEETRVREWQWQNLLTFFLTGPLPEFNVKIPLDHRKSLEKNLKVWYNEDCSEGKEYMFAFNILGLWGNWHVCSCLC